MAAATLAAATARVVADIVETSLRKLLAVPPLDRLFADGRAAR